MKVTWTRSETKAVWGMEPEIVYDMKVNGLLLGAVFAEFEAHDRGGLKASYSYAVSGYRISMLGELATKNEPFIAVNDTTTRASALAKAKALAVKLIDRN